MMKRKAMRNLVWVGCALWLATAGGVAQGDQAKPWPAFEHVVQAIQTHLPDLDRDELNAALVQALLDHYHPRVELVPVGQLEAAEAQPASLEAPTIFDRSFGYIRIHTVAAGLDRQLRDAWVEVSSGNQLRGLVLDLRFAGGHDYTEAARVADLFVASTEPLISWSDTVIRATPDQEIVRMPIVVLMNQESRGAAEALAGALREAGVALLVGSPTGGQAHMFQEYDLPGGRVLRVASEPVRVGEGRSMAGGLAPDIEVRVSLADERQYMEDPFAVIPGALTGTALRAERSRVNEAELMRQHQPGARPGSLPMPAPPAGTQDSVVQDPVVQDPALARGLDLLKGISLVSRPR
jgi:hypothetical protein